jgi:hypothetical protein
MTWAIHEPPVYLVVYVNLVQEPVFKFPDTRVFKSLNRYHTYHARRVEGFCAAAERQT